MKTPSLPAASCSRKIQNRCRPKRDFLLLGAVAWLIAVRAGADPFPVTDAADNGGAGTLRTQIANALNAGPGTTVNFSSTLTVTSIQLAMGELVINKDLTIQGPGATNMLLLNNAGRIFHITSGATVTISGLTMTGTVVGANGANGILGSPDGQPGTSITGGAISNDNSCMLTLSNCVFTNCTAIAGNGGDAYSNAQESFTMPGNGSYGGVASGGALANDGDCSIIGCTFVNNFAQGGAGGRGHDGGLGGPGGEGDGGGVEDEYDASTFSIVNSTFNGNMANGGAGGQGGDAFFMSLNAPGGAGGKGGDALGGAIYVSKGCPDATCDGVLHCTISGNVSAPGFGGLGGAGANGGANGVNGLNGLPDGCGLFFSRVQVLPIGNSIIAGNFARSGFTPFGPDVGGPSPNPADITSNNHNLIGLTDGSTGWIVGDLQGSGASGFLNPVLGPLQINAGQTPTMAPLACSLAIDAGATQGLTNDQAGQPRRVIVHGVVDGGDGTDIGAYELQAFPTVNLSVVQANGNITISWPAPDASCFLLQETTNLNPPGQWTDATNRVNVLGNQNQVVIPGPVTGNLFFRLEYP